MSLFPNGLYRFDDFELDPARRVLARNGKTISLSPKAFDVLAYLIAHPRRPVSKEELLKAVWPESFVEESNLSQHIYWLRKALGDKADNIVTLPGRGYQFAADVHVTALPTSQPARPAAFGRMRERSHVVIEESTLVPAVGPTLLLAAPRRRLGWMAGFALVLAAATFAGLWLQRHFAKPPQLRKVVVADFLNLTGDPAFDHNLKNALGIALGQSPYIQLMGDGEVQSVLSSMEKPADTLLLGDTVLEVCRRGNYQAALRGKIESSGGSFGGYRLTLDVVNCASGKTLSTLHADALNKDAVLNTLDTLSGRARSDLGESGSSIEQFDIPLINASTFSFEALQDFNTGSLLGNAGKLQECIPYFQKAVEIDPKFAMAQASLGTAYYDLGATEKGGEYSKTAYDLSAGVSEWEKLFLRHNYYLMTLHDLEAAVKNAQEWTRTYPEDVTAWEALTDLETQIGDFQQAIAAGERTLRFGWRPSISFESLTRAYMRANRFADAKRVVAEAQAQGKDDPQLHHLLFEIAIIERDAEAIQREIAWNQREPELYVSLEYQAVLAADQGKVHQAEDLYRSATLAANRDGTVEISDAMLLNEARIEVQLGRAAAAKDLLREVRDRDTVDFAVVEAGAGDASAAEAYLKRPEEYPHGTIEHKLLLPELLASLALSHNDSANAIALLEPARTFELARPGVIELRANAYLAAGRADDAAAEFQKLIANPGLEDPMLPRTNVAHLELARAFAMRGDRAESRKEYEKFFTLWKEGDSDVPVLQEAHKEYLDLE